MAYLEQCASNNMIKQVYLCIHSVARRTSEEKLKRLEGEQGALERKVREATDASNSIADDLRLMTNQRDQLSQEKRNLEVSGRAGKCCFCGCGDCKAVTLLFKQPVIILLPFLYLQPPFFLFLSPSLVSSLFLLPLSPYSPSLIPSPHPSPQ